MKPVLISAKHLHCRTWQDIARNSFGYFGPQTLVFGSRHDTRAVLCTYYIVICLQMFCCVIVTKRSQRLSVNTVTVTVISISTSSIRSPSETMSDDFLRLVSQSNPAARQYQPANNGYPPSSTPYADQSPQLLDPFFDDDDENMPDSAFGRPAPMQSQESGLPLARSAAPPAGSGPSTVSLPATGVPQGWTFDEDDFRPANNPPFAGSTQFSGTPSAPSENRLIPSRKRRWKWPWQKEKVLAGERIIALNNSQANADYASNFISTSKYNLASFVPKFLTGAFRYSH